MVAGRRWMLGPLLDLPAGSESACPVWVTSAVTGRWLPPGSAPHAAASSSK